MISVQTEDFDLAFEYGQLRLEEHTNGAIVTFTGLVRDFNQQGQLQGLELEHYPGMTEKVLAQICQQAKDRWDLTQIRLIHRVGYLAANEQIVFVGVTSLHRQNAFDAAQFIMDRLKTQAPFWKQEVSEKEKSWVEAKLSDTRLSQRWE